MSKYIKQYGLLLLVSLLLFSCKDKKSNAKPNVAGKAGELLIVMDDKIKQSEAGKELQRAVLELYLGLPQEEPHFDMLITPHRGFSSYFKTFRNLIVTDVSPNIKTDTIKYYRDYWARPQSMVRISAKDTVAMRQIVERHTMKMLSFFNRAERERNIQYFKATPNSELIDTIKKVWNVKLNIPANFKKRNTKPGITWLGEDTEWGSQGFMVYEFPYIGEGTFSREYLLNKRDSILHKNIPGPSAGSYMTTEHKYPPVYKKTTINDIPVVELRGLWKVQNDMMGGAFILHAHHDVANNRVVVTDGFVYSPEKPDKRDKIRQLEALMYTFNFLK
ncbi:DUF4837 family protein [Carboxylicivirga linearis]|uniref:DUF4837 family protein n=1 Tax=Carboxylicivirga linearis TaxID=1628157 RepID=A0ABS5JTS4_9BACT|nr:DUF4837 family protein [Carboxylicivirga linearis]MBS2097766.1 DUF4837 family protein [Carboxylicivirga linearis]